MIRVLRPKQWIKNLFVFAPLVFAGGFLQKQEIITSVFAFMLFCLAASSVYIVNDIRDIEKDRLHPKKSRTRPLASGALKVRWAVYLLFLLYIMLVASAFFMPSVAGVIAVYIAVNYAYTFKLKQVPVVEIFAVASGFVLRVYAGAVALQVDVSQWMFVTTLCIALYLAAVKRRQELKQNGTHSRAVLHGYTPELIDKFAEMSATCSVVFYSLYVMSAHQELIWTIPLVLFGLFRYWFVVEALGEGESPTDAVVKDKQILLTVLLWLVCCIWALWPA